MRNLTLLGGTLTLFWLLLSGHYTPLLLALGMLSVAATLVIAVRMGLVGGAGGGRRSLLAYPGFVLWLGGEIVRSNLDVVRRIFDPRMPVRRRVVRVDVTGLDTGARALLANAITLTPGTVSMEIEGDEIVVHALSDAAAEGVLSGEMTRRVAALGGRD